MNNNKIYYVENDQTREFYHDDENDTVDIYDMGIYDGLHYSNATYLRIFDYCMRDLNR